MSAEAKTHELPQESRVYGRTFKEGAKIRLFDALYTTKSYVPDLRRWRTYRQCLFAMAGGTAGAGAAIVYEIAVDNGAVVSADATCDHKVLVTNEFNQTLNVTLLDGRTRQRLDEKTIGVNQSVLLQRLGIESNFRTGNNVPAFRDILAANGVERTVTESCGRTATFRFFERLSAVPTAIATAVSKATGGNAEANANASVVINPIQPTFPITSEIKPGPPGPQGERGSQGPAGPVGPIGPEGALPWWWWLPGVAAGVASGLIFGAIGRRAGWYRGADGAPGAVGPQGVPGPAGANGHDGADGAPGVAGHDGAPGPQGPIGPQGVPGPAGANGHDGADGAPGVAGHDGAPGAAGLKGDKGDKGDTGPQGPEGPAGRDGRDGRDGAGARDGRDGREGTTGPMGRDGRDGHP